MDRVEIETWLLEADPALSWQVLQDLLGAPPDRVDAARARVGTEGWGARLLAAQDPDGTWSGALYSPKWTSTTYTLLLLHRLGLPPDDTSARAGCRALWAGARWHDGGLTLAKTIREPETCITGMLVLLASVFDHAHPLVDNTVDWLLAQQLADGGWNCESIRNGSSHGSFHTSVTVLEALLAYERAGGDVPVASAMVAGREFLLRHRLYRSHRTGEVADHAFTRFPFPPQWHFDVVRGLEHFRDAGAPRDDRLADAVEVVRRARRTDGTWPHFRPYPGRYFFAFEGPGSSRWSTLRALRLLDWWES